MGIANTCPAFIKVPGKRAERMVVLKSSIRLVRRNLVAMRVVKGFRAKMKRVPEKFTTEIFVDLVDLYLYPLGTKAGLENTDTIELVLTCASDIYPDLVDKYRDMEAEKNMALDERNRLKDERDKLKDEIEKLKKENKDLTGDIRDMAKRSS